jgi:hypothetical protein
MTGTNSRFLQAIEVLFDDAIVDSVFRPAVADFQGELRDGGDTGTKALLLRCRWFGALVVLVGVTTVSLARSSRLPRTHPVDGNASMLFLYAPLIAGAWWCVQVFAGAAVVGGVLLACALHAWNLRHRPVVGLSIDQQERPARGPVHALPVADAPFVSAR